ncbi:MAG: hypothetical protein JO004_00945 [Methylobacteriaceae bacterium]|nr:hypothetical protein [Methylobacteriaceae bacterium]
MGHVQAIHVVPRIPAQPRTARGGVAPRQVLRQTNRMAPDNRFGRNRFRHARGGLFLPYAPYIVDMGEAGGSQLPAAYDSGPAYVPFQQPACVRPLIIHVKPARHAIDYPRVVYGRPLPC